MRNIDLRCWLAGLVVTSAVGCEDGGQRTTVSDEPAAPMALQSCPLDARTSAGDIAVLAGSGRSIPLADGTWMWAFDVATVVKGAEDTVVFAAAASLESVSGDEVAGCATASATLHDDGAGGAVLVSQAPNQGEAVWLIPRDGVLVGGTSWLYYTAIVADDSNAFGLRIVGHGVAPYDEEQAAFVASDELLWDETEPSFGTSAVVDPTTGDVIVHGCVQGTADFIQDCFVARVEPDQLSNPDAYRYFNVEGEWVQPLGEASPILAAGSASVRYMESVSLWVWADSPVFGTTIRVRTAESPEGPWGAATTIGACDIPEGLANAYCGDVTLHQHLADEDDARALVLSYQVSSLGDVDTPPTPHGPRLVLTRLPEETISW